MIDPKNMPNKDAMVMRLVYQFHEDLMYSCAVITYKPSVNQVTAALLNMHGMTQKHKPKQYLW